MAWSRVSPIALSPVPIGSVVPFAGIAPPTDWLLCDGSAISRTTYATLLSSITVARSFATTNTSTSVTTGDTTNLVAGMIVEGTGIPSGATISSITNSTTFVLSSAATATGTATLTFFAFGRGDGSSTFNLPDLRGRVLLGSGTGIGSQNTSAGPLSGSGLPTGGSSLTARAVGQWGGQESHTLTSTSIPSHTHTVGVGQTSLGETAGMYHRTGNSTFGSGDTGGGGGAGSNLTTINHTSSSVGSDGTHNNTQPFAVSHHIIRAF